MKSRHLAWILALACIMAALLGCAPSAYSLDPDNPVTITMWHNYGGQMKDTMDALIAEFNNTLGRERGIVISVTSIQASKDQNEKLAMIARGDPGAPLMPDIATAYPSVALLLAEANLLAPLDDYFTEAELSGYISPFLEEGRLPDGKLYVFPVSKSTEALFVNKTLFDRFSSATGVTMESLSTFEGIASAAEKYYIWTDAQDAGRSRRRQDLLHRRFVVQRCPCWRGAAGRGFCGGGRAEHKRGGFSKNLEIFRAAGGHRRLCR